MKFATKQNMKIDKQKSILDHTTTYLKYVDIGQYRKDNLYSPVYNEF